MCPSSDATARNAPDGEKATAQIGVCARAPMPSNSHEGKAKSAAIVSSQPVAMRSPCARSAPDQRARAPAAAAVSARRPPARGARGSRAHLRADRDGGHGVGVVLDLAGLARQAVHLEHAHKVVRATRDQVPAARRAARWPGRGATDRRRARARRRRRRRGGGDGARGARGAVGGATHRPSGL
jgi:hypothetical protein